jgi:hypothetical protein
MIMKRVILGVVFVAAMSLAVSVSAKDGKTKKESPKTEQCCQAKAKAGDKKTDKECCKKDADKKCCQQAKDGKKKACDAKAADKK